MCVLYYCRKLPVKEINLTRLLTELEMTQNEVRILIIFICTCTCVYNSLSTCVYYWAVITVTLLKVKVHIEVYNVYVCTGVGPVNAMKLLRQHGNIETIVSSLMAKDGKVRESINLIILIIVIRNIKYQKTGPMR